MAGDKEGILDGVRMGFYGILKNSGWNLLFF
jgi:hypothetical protein